MAPFFPSGRPTLIGSLPLSDHEEAADLVFSGFPEIPVWIQLPRNPGEGMVEQFAQGLPGWPGRDGHPAVRKEATAFDRELLAFFEDYLAVTSGEADLEGSRFALSRQAAPGFFVFLERLAGLAGPPLAVKGQITGPITFTTGIKDGDGRAIFHDPQLREAAVKLLGLKARWQVRRLSAFGSPVILFFDEPALAGVGSSEFTSISDAEIAACLSEVFGEVHAEGGLAGIHVCANTDWSLVLGSSADIVNFDAFAYFDKLFLYRREALAFLASGRVLAWGIVPTRGEEEIRAATAEALVSGWEEMAGRFEAEGISRGRLLSQALITPSCGLGARSPEAAQRVLRLTREVSEALRSRP